VGAVKTGAKFCSRVRKESVISMGRLPCVGVLRPRQVAKKSRGSRPVFLLSHSPSKVRNKNIGPTEAKLVAFYALITPLVVLPLVGWAVASTEGRAGLVTNDGVRGFTEIVFAYASCMANNGQNMAGLNANSIFYNITTILAMMAGRFVLAALALELAGRFACQGRKAETIGTLPSDTITFGILVLGTVLLIGALSFLPVLALGPIAEYLKTAPGV